VYVVDLQVVFQRFNIPLHTSNPEMCTHLRKRILIPHARVCTCVRACWHARKRACVRVCVRANACRRVGTECVHAATTTGLPSNSVCSPVMLFAGEAFPPRNWRTNRGVGPSLHKTSSGSGVVFWGASGPLAACFPAGSRLHWFYIKLKSMPETESVVATFVDCWCHFCGLWHFGCLSPALTACTGGGEAPATDSGKLSCKSPNDRDTCTSGRQSYFKSNLHL